MSCIVYQVNKKTGIKYAYESVSYWDKDLQQPRSKRKYIGRVDPETGEVINERKNKSKSSGNPSSEKELERLQKRINDMEETITTLNSEIKSLREKNRVLENKIRKVRLMVAEELANV